MLWEGAFAALLYYTRRNNEKQVFVRYAIVIVVYHEYVLHCCGIRIGMHTCRYRCFRLQSNAHRKKNAHIYLHLQPTGKVAQL